MSSKSSWFRYETLEYSDEIFVAFCRIVVTKLKVLMASVIWHRYEFEAGCGF